MGYMATVPLRFGDGHIMPGEPVPVEQGRNYASLLRRGAIAVVSDDVQASQAKRSEGPKGDAGKQGSGDGEREKLEKLSRKEVDELAAQVGVEDPDKLANRGAVIDAIEAKRSEG